MRADIKVWFTCHPDIHLEDARNAILAWFKRTSKERRKPPHIVLEKALIASAVNDKDGKKVLPPVWRDHRGKVLDVSSDGFEIRWKRAQKDGRKPICGQIGDFVLRNWREIRWPELAKQNCPGLCEWSPLAASALIRTLPDAANAGDETWYVKKRNRLGLTGKRRYRVHDFRRYKDSRYEVEID
jgi:hypothetical protein